MKPGIPKTVKEPKENAAFFTNRDFRQELTWQKPFLVMSLSEAGGAKTTTPSSNQRPPTAEVKTAGTGAGTLAVPGTFAKNNPLRGLKKNQVFLCRFKMDGFCSD